jgi:hypothetical protein
MRRRVSWQERLSALNAVIPFKMRGACAWYAAINAYGRSNARCHYAERLRRSYRMRFVKQNLDAALLVYKRSRFREKGMLV